MDKAKDIRIEAIDGVCVMYMKEYTTRKIY